MPSVLSLRRRAAAPLLVVVLLGGCRRPPAIDVTHAQSHLQVLAGTIGSRPTGSPELARAREYVISELRELGFTIRLQETLAVDPTQGISAPVANVIAIKAGAVRDAIALISHYDSVPEAMGAVDAGLGVAAVLESARELVKQPLRYSLLVILTDAEELGLLGARVVVSDADVADRVRAFLNFDGTGAAGPGLLFEAGPGRGTPLEAWAREAAEPEGASFTTEIYRRLPNDTDFTVFKALNTSGLNFAPVGDSYAYHTDRDVVSRVSPETLRHMISNAVSTVRAIDARAFTTDPRTPPTYFDLAGLGAIVYGPGAARAFAVLGVLLGVVAWGRLTRALWRERRLPGLVLTALWSAFAAVTTAGAMVAAVTFLRTLRPELTPWYAEPRPFFLFLAACGVAGAWTGALVARLMPETGRPIRDPRATWWVALPVWIGLAIFLQRSAPTAAYLVTLPLVGAGLLALVAGARVTRLRIVSLAVLLDAVFFGLSDLPRLLGFLVPLLGWLPLVAPVWLFPAVFAMAGVLVGPPLAAALAGLAPRTVTPLRAGALLAVVIALTGYQALRVAAYTADRPERRQARYVQDDVKGVAWWEVGGLEPGLRLAGAGPDGARWTRVTEAPSASLRLAPLNQPIAFRTPSPAAATPPGDVRATLTRLESDRARVEITIVPHENLIARLVLPRDLMPSDSTLAGQVSAGQWSATYVSPPQSGVTVRLTFDRWTERTPSILITLTTVGLPGGSGRLKLPSWLPQATATWRARSVFISEVRIDQ
jgi:hypothetical protein